jgi:hypothetical protein
MTRHCAVSFVADVPGGRKQRKGEQIDLSGAKKAQNHAQDEDFVSLLMNPC